MEKRWARVSAAFLLAALLLFLQSTSQAQQKQTIGLKTLALGLIFQGPSEPVAEHFRPLVDYVGRKLAPAEKIKTRVVVVPSAAQLMRLLEEREVDFYLESPFPTYLINRSGSGRLLLRRWKSGMSDYRGIIFTSEAGGIARLEDLRGKVIAFEDAGSTSGYFLPKLLLFERGFSVVEKPGPEAKVGPREIGYVFGGTEKNVVKLVVEKTVAAGAISNDDYASLDKASKAGLSLLAESGSLPRHLLSVRRNLPQDVVKRLKDILLAMDRDDEGRRILRRTDNTTRFDELPGGEEAFRRKLIQLYRLRAGK